MPIEKKAFRKYDLEDNKRDIVPCSLNNEERAMVERSKMILQQEKDSTTLKQLATIGYKRITEPVTLELLETIFLNKRKNERNGISFDDEIYNKSNT